MIQKDVTEFARSHWNAYLKSAKELSQNKNTGKSLVESSLFMYDIDAVSLELSGKADGRKPRSADALCVGKKGAVFLIEFKSGVKWVLTRNHQAEGMEKRLREKEMEEFKLSILLKAVESYLLLEKQVLLSPEIKEIEPPSKPRQVCYLAVIDSDTLDPASVQGDMLAELAGLSGETEPNQAEKDRFLQDLRERLKRLHTAKDAVGNDYLYDRIDVVSNKEFPPASLCWRNRKQGR